ncbi:MAG TPA: hypothetical protein VN673_13010 [Clostridia bacterium]|nr:hypothetical protein [Clostridia bacterium]
MKGTLLALAAILALGALLVWAATGAHRGWTQTSVMKKTVDDITGLEAVTYEKRFVMGVEVLGGAWAGAGLLAGTALLLRQRRQQQPDIPQ